MNELYLLVCQRPISSMCIADLIVLEVEDTIYVVNRKNLLDDSEFFRELFSLPPEQGKPIEGSCLNCPLRVEGVKKTDMELLLRAVYPRCVMCVVRCGPSS